MRDRAARILIVALFAALPAFAADGDYDPAFDGDGIHFYASPGSYGSAMLRAPDDAVVIWGTRSEATSASEVHWRRIAVGGVGTLCTFTPPGAEFLAARGAAFDPDGRLLIAVAVDFGAGTVLGVLRVLYPACDLDSAFDGGFATHALDLGPGGATEIVGVAAARWYEPFPLQRRRVLVAIARAGDGTFVRDTWLVRLLDDGQLDSGFGGGDGVAMIAPGRFARGLAGGLDGKFLIPGLIQAGGDEDTFVLRIDRSGVPDPGFGTGGEAVVDFTPAGVSSDDLTRISAAPDGRIVLAGATDFDAQPGVFTHRGAVAVLRSNGTPDTSFSADGRTFTAAFGYSTRATAAVMQGDGRILLSAWTQDGPSLPFDGVGPDGFGHVLRLARHGPLDSTFGTDGRVDFDWDLVPDGADGAQGVALAEDGRIWVEGAVETPVSGGTDQRVWVARLANSYLFADGFERGSAAGW
jgi:uncharacterized delta-60 repeat protein